MTVLRLSSDELRGDEEIVEAALTRNGRALQFSSDCWYKTLWKFIEARPVEILEGYPSLPTLREGDKFLMKCFMESGYSGADLKKLNYA